MPVPFRRVLVQGSFSSVSGLCQPLSAPQTLPGDARGGRRLWEHSRFQGPIFQPQPWPRSAQSPRLPSERRAERPWARLLGRRGRTVALNGCLRGDRRFSGDSFYRRWAGGLGHLVGDGASRPGVRRTGRESSLERDGTFDESSPRLSWNRTWLCSPICSRLRGSRSRGRVRTRAGGPDPCSSR